MSEPNDMLEQRLMEVLLNDLYSDEKYDTNQQARVEKLMAAIDQQQALQKKTVVSRFMAIAASLCCVVLIFATVISPSPNAIAEIDLLTKQLQEIEDRAFSVSLAPIEIDSGESLAVQQHTKKTEKTLQWLKNATLYIRGDSQYLLLSETEKGRVIRARDLSQSWKRDHKERVKFFNDYQRIKLPFSGDVASLAFLDMPNLLAILAERYELSAKHSSNGSVLEAKKSKKGQKGVPRIEVFYNAESYEIDRLAFYGVHLQGNSKKYMLVLERIESEVLPDGFFSPSYHTADMDF